MTYTYDLADNLLTATGPGGAVTTLTYDKLGRKLTMNDPDMGYWTYAYDGSGNLARQTDQKNQRLCFYYDAANRPTSKRSDGTGAAACPGTQGGTELAGYGYYTSGAGKGLLANVAGGSGVGGLADTFFYDYRGRMTTHNRVIGGSAGQTTIMSTTYDDVDRPLTVTMTPKSGTAHTATYTYDGEFAKTLALSGFGQIVTDVDYNHRGQLTSIKRAGTDPDTTLTYHPQGEGFRLSEIRYGNATDALPDFLYSGYDNLGNLQQLTTKRWSDEDVQEFEYDAVSRLTSAAGTGMNGIPAYDYDFSYGSGGNLATWSDNVNEQTRTYAYDTAANHHAHALISITGEGPEDTFGYDNNGNMLSRKVDDVLYTQEFDVENRLKKVTTEAGAVDPVTEFFYDDDGNRTLTIYGTGANQVKVYTPFPNFEETVPASGATTQRTSYTLAGQLIAVRVRSGTTGNGTLSYAYGDHLGSVSAWSSDAGVYIANSIALFEPYGDYRFRPPASVNPGLSARGFTGHRHNNAETNDIGLIYMNARYYLPEIGRFISADTIVPEPSNPQSYNRYSYGFNNPVKYSDPTGHLSEDEIDEYFGFQDQQQMRDAGWIEDLVSWLWDPEVTWGDVFTYNDGAGEAMLALVEAKQQDSGLYRGIFWGLNGEDSGEEVYASQIKSLDDHTNAATVLEALYHNRWENLPKRTGSDGYNNYDPTTYVDALTVSTVSAGASLGGLFFIGGPAPWIARGITMIGGATAAFQIATDDLTYNYPVLRLPTFLGNAPFTIHTVAPSGLYK